jgi:hypothetical protein
VALAAPVVDSFQGIQRHPFFIVFETLAFKPFRAFPKRALLGYNVPSEEVVFREAELEFHKSTPYIAYLFWFDKQLLGSPPILRYINRPIVCRVIVEMLIIGKFVATIPLGAK